jgi:pimeloyl-ACP methyl ester carboxylesterase
MRFAQIFALIAALVAVLGGGGVFVSLRFYPIEIYNLRAKIDLWFAGAHILHAENLVGYEKNGCAGEALKGKSTQPAPICNCIALIHGLGDTALTWKRVFQSTAADFTEPVHFVAFQLPGTGGSETPQNPTYGYRVRKQAETLRKALAPICPHWELVGNSLGGWIASWLALDWPEGVTKLMLVDSAGLKSSTVAARTFFEEPTGESLKEFDKKAFFKHREVPDFVWRAAAEEMRESTANDTIKAQTEDDFLDSRLSSLQIPTFLVWGKEDGIIPLSSGEAMHALIHGSTLKVIPDCGHLPQKECVKPLLQSIESMIRYGSM